MELIHNNEQLFYFVHLSQERICKLENEQSALHMEISVLLEQVDAQSNKIVELENALQEKRNALLHMEELLQNVIYIFL